MDIKAYREKHQLSQKAFGALVGVTQGAVAHWEAGKSIDVESVKAVARATCNEVSAHDLMPGVFPRGFAFPPEPELQAEMTSRP
jgi:transcriptional regulator with XRE-family HTH domain